jgi:hypothetical protein
VSSSIRSTSPGIAKRPAWIMAPDASVGPSDALSGVSGEAFCGTISRKFPMETGCCPVLGKGTIRPSFEDSAELLHQRGEQRFAYLPAISTTTIIAMLTKEW